MLFTQFAFGQQGFSLNKSFTTFLVFNEADGINIDKPTGIVNTPVEEDVFLFHGLQFYGMISLPEKR